MSKQPNGQARVTIDGYGSTIVTARTAGAAVCRARRQMKARTRPIRHEGWWENVELDWLPSRANT